MLHAALIPILVALSAEPGPFSLPAPPTPPGSPALPAPPPPADDPPTDRLPAPSAFTAEVHGLLADWEAAEADRAGAGPGRGPGRSPVDPHPAQVFFPRFEAQVDAGWGAGRVWLLEHLDRAGLAPSRRRERRAVLLDALLATADSAPVRSVERALLELEAHPAELGDDRRTERTARLLEERPEPEVRAAAHAALGRLYFVRLDAAAGATALAAVEEQLHLARAAAPGSRGARRATTFLFELRERAYRAEVETWAAAWSDGDPETEPGAHPVELYWPSMEHLADGGAGRALWWMAREARLLEREEAELAELRGRLLERIVEDHSDAPWLREELQFTSALVEDLGRDELERLGERLLQVGDDPELSAWVLHGLASLAAADESDAEGVARAIELIERLVDEHPGHPLALSAEDRLFALRHLRVGQIPPERRAEDGRGRPLTLGQYRGKLTLLVFWGFWSPQAERDLARLRALDARYAPEPFAIVGVNTDDDPTRARERFLAAGNGWRNAYEGRRSGPWTQSWSVRDFPTYFLFAPDGRIIAKGVDLTAIEARLEQEVAALRAARRRPSAPTRAGEESPVEGRDGGLAEGADDGARPAAEGPDADAPAGGDAPAGVDGSQPAPAPNPQPGAGSDPAPEPDPEPDSPAGTGKGGGAGESDG